MPRDASGGALIPGHGTTSVKPAVQGLQQDIEKTKFFLRLFGLVPKLGAVSD
jgi:hypothetical protein